MSKPIQIGLYIDTCHPRHIIHSEEAPGYINFHFYNISLVQEFSRYISLKSFYTKYDPSIIVLGHIAIERNNENQYYSVLNIQLQESLRGKGNGSLIYDLVNTCIFPYGLTSDYIVSAASKRIWMARYKRHKYKKSRLLDTSLKSGLNKSCKYIYYYKDEPILKYAKQLVKNHKRFAKSLIPQDYKQLIQLLES